jgi:glycerophosphoryl diester phosphodiesterase
MAHWLTLPWLTSHPIAHRGLHDAAQGVIENALSAFRAAIHAGYAIECDVQISEDGEAVVFHDATLDRLTARTGLIKEHSAEELTRIPLKGSGDTLITLTTLLKEIAGRVPVFIEIKSAFDKDMHLTRCVIDRVRHYEGPVALMSFDPACIAYVRQQASHIPCGIVAQSAPLDEEGLTLSDTEQHALSHLLHLPQTQPDFLAWRAFDLPCEAPSLFRTSHKPVLTWTIRSPEDAQKALVYADQIIFEGFRA